MADPAVPRPPRLPGHSAGFRFHFDNQPIGTGWTPARSGLHAASWKRPLRYGGKDATLRLVLEVPAGEVDRYRELVAKEATKGGHARLVEPAPGTMIA